MQGFIAGSESFSDDRVILSGAEHHHATRSCRVRPGEEIGITDGAGRRVIARIENIDQESLVAVVVRDVSGAGELPFPLTLALAVIKPGLFELAVEKATELAARRIVPLVCERSAYAPRRLNGERLDRILRGAVKQSGRSYIPEVAEPHTIGELIERRGDTRLFVADCRTERRLPSQIPAGYGGIVIAIGPEGDFTNGEYDILYDAGAIPFSLGGLVLRAETASIAGIAVAADMIRSGA